MSDRDGQQRHDAAGSFQPPPFETGVDASQVFGAIRENGKIIGGVAIGFALLILGLTLAAHMEFKTQGRMYLGELESSAQMASKSSADPDFASNEPSDLGSEIEILQSKPLVERAILASGINVSARVWGTKPARYWRWRISGRDPKLLDTALQSIVPIDVSFTDHTSGVRSLGIQFLSSDTYEVWSDKTHRLGQGRLGKPFTSREVTLTLQPGPGPRPTRGARYDIEVTALEEVVNSALKSLTIGYPKAITQGEAPRVISLEFTHGSPLLAARFLRELMNAYLEERRSWKTENASAAEAFVTNQLQLIRKSLDQTERRLTEYRTTNSSVALDTEAEAMIGQIGRYEEQRVASKLELATLADIRRELKNPNAKLEAFLASGISDPVLDGLTRSLSESRKALTAAQDRFHEDQSPDVRMRKAEVDSQLSVIKNYVETRHARAQQNLAAMNQVISQFEQKLQTVPGAELGLAQLARESEVYSKLFSYLLERQQQAAIFKASTVSKNRILDMPSVPVREASPSLLTRAGVALFGLVLGLFIVIARLAFAPTIQTDHDVQRLAGGLPIFASIPRRSTVTPSGKGADYDVLSSEPSSPFTEAFRMLRANLYQLPNTGDGKVVMFTSPCPGDGKSTSAVALAVMLAADSKNVLLIDSDIRKPSHHVLLKQRLEPGLSDVITRECDWLTATRPVATAYGDFYSMTAGRRAAAELLSTSNMATLIMQAKRRFDFVIIDSASFPLVSDALVLSPHVDCVLSVLRLRHTPKKLAAQHVRRMAMHAADYGLIANGGAPNEGYGYVADHPRGRVASRIAAETNSTVN